MAVVAAMLLDGCIGSGGSSAPPPTNVVARAQDSRVTITWDASPGIEYWIFKAAGTNVTPQSCSSQSECGTVIKAVSPQTIWGLSDGTTYAFTINARVNGGPGGAGSTAVQAVPRLAGATWSSGTALGANDLHGVAYGNTTGFGGMFIAAGNNGSLYNALTDGYTWTASSNNPYPTTNFNAVNFDSYRSEYVVVGSGGIAMFMTGTAGSLWAGPTSGTTGTTQDLYAVANNGAGTTVATGANGTIITSADGGATWTIQTSGTSNALYAVSYGYSSTLGYTFVAVGASGTMLYSADGVTWTSVTPVTGVDLKTITFGYNSSAVGTFVAAGVGGTMLTSTDASTWTALTSISSVSTSTLNAVTYGRQFVAVNAAGGIFLSSDAATWTQVTSPTTSPIYAVAPGGLYDYSAVGASGLNLYAD